MKKFFSGFWFRLSLFLALLSALLHMLHLLIFKDGHHLAIYLFGDIAFVPLEVLLVSVIIHRLMEQRSRKEQLNKMNMLIGVFLYGNRKQAAAADCRRRQHPGTDRNAARCGYGLEEKGLSLQRPDARPRARRSFA